MIIDVVLVLLIMNNISVHHATVFGWYRTRGVMEGNK